MTERVNLRRMATQARHPLYDDPLLYARLFPPEPGEVAFWQQVIGPAPCSILELGAGSGALALPLAAAGHHVTALERSAAMRSAAPPADRVEWVDASMESFELGRPFDRIGLFSSALQHLPTLDALIGCLTAARRHLAVDGRLLIDLPLFDPETLAIPESAATWLASCEHPREGGRYELYAVTRYDPLRQLRRLRLLRRVAIDRFETVGDLTLRVIFPQELEALLRWSGFEIDSQWGGFDGAPLSAAARQLLLACRPADRAPSG